MQLLPLRTWDPPLDSGFPIRLDLDIAHGDAPIQFLHRHPYLELGICVAGAGVFAVGDQLLPFSAGDVSIMRVMDPHLLASAPGTVSLWHWVYLAPTVLSSTDPVGWRGEFGAAAFSAVVSPSEDSDIRGLMNLLVGELRDRAGEYRASVRLLANLIFIRLNRMHRGSKGGADETGTRSALERIEPGLISIAAGYAERLSVADLAARCNMSEGAFRRAFRVATGQSPREYWVRMRLALAAAMLTDTSAPVSEVCHAVGFTSQPSFHRLFVAEFGLSPGGWRRRSREG